MAENIPLHLGAHDVRRIVDEHRFGMPCYVKMFDEDNGTKSALITFRGSVEAEALLRAGVADHAICWAPDWYARIRFS